MSVRNTSMKTMKLFGGLLLIGFLANSPATAANAVLQEDLVACTDRQHVEKLHVILLGDSKEVEFVNAVEASVQSGQCIELQKGQKITIAEIVAPDHVEIHELPYKMMLVSLKPEGKRYWIYDIDAVKKE